MKDWNKLKEKYNDIETELKDIPEWHKAELDKRLDDHRNNPDQILDFNDALYDIDKEL